MPKDLSKEDINPGRIVYAWTVKEYEKYDRSHRWYLATGIALAAFLAFALLSGNYLFALVIILFGIVLYLHDMQEPMDVYFAITDTGIILGRRYYRFSELKNFWLIYNPPEIKTIYFTLNSVVKHRLQVPLLEYDPRAIRDHLNQYLTEDLEQEEEPLSDTLARVFKIH